MQGPVSDLPAVAAAAAAPRKQNIACDACRTRKVKCVMTPSQDRCQHCQTKSYPCTFNVQRETSEKKRQGTARRRSNETTSSTMQNSPAFSSSLSSSASHISSHQSSNYTTDSPSATTMSNYYSNTFNGLESRPQHLAQPISSTPAPAHGTPFLPSHLPSHDTQQSFPETPTTRLIAYLLSPEDPSPLYPPSMQGYRALPDYQQRHSPRLNDWGEVALKLQDPAFRIEFTLDLVEVYFEICNTRVALVNPPRFRAQLQASLPPSTSNVHSSPASLPRQQLHGSPLSAPATAHSPAQPPLGGGVNPAVLATVLAWGAKFSEHPLIVQDRNADPAGARRSRLANSLIRKAREVAEAEKMHIVPSPDAVVVCMLLDGLHSHRQYDPEGYRAFWLNCGVRHLTHLQINNRSAALGLVEPDRMDMMVYAWWMACLADSFSSLYFRRKPVLEDEDYTVDVYPQDIARIAQAAAGVPESEKALEIVARPEFLAWYAASHELARCAREMSRQISRPLIQAAGIPIELLCSLIQILNGWRVDHLDKVGVPGVQVDWDFLAAVAACSHDSTFHVMWVILFQALRDFGIREVNDAKRAGNKITSLTLAAQIAATESQVREEALNGASRIAGLTNLLTQSGYLRLDPNIMHYSIYAAGKLLAEFGREEVGLCIRGLQQYGIAYEDALDQAAEIQRAAAATAAATTATAATASVAVAGPAPMNPVSSAQQQQQVWGGGGGGGGAGGSGGNGGGAGGGASSMNGSANHAASEWRAPHPAASESSQTRTSHTLQPYQMQDGGAYTHDTALAQSQRR